MKTKIITIFTALALLLAGCSDYLDREALDKLEDEKFWTDANRLSLYANEFYPYFFVGYGTGGDAYVALNGYSFNDDMVQNSNSQTNFVRAVPTSGTGSTSSSVAWQSTFNGPNWNFYWIRKANVMLDRIETKMTGILSTTDYNHWTGVARFFRALEYARLVNVFGDVPYYNFEVKTSDIDELYKERTPRNDVMDAVFEDFEFAMNNMKANDGDQKVNKYVAAAFVSRWALIEASWQKYHYSNNERAEKFFDLAINAAEIVMNSNKYAIDSDFRSLFGSYAPTGKEVILYRAYDASLGMTHSMASQCNLKESRNMGASLSLIKAFICNDGQPWQNSTVEKAKDFTVSEMIKTRDPRFEATFWDRPSPMAKGSFLAIAKFISRKGASYTDTPDTEFTSNNNVNGYPVMRHAEVLLNWIEAKAELATLGGSEVSQSDIDLSINKIRDRELDEEAKAKGVQKTAPMYITLLPDDPDRDPTVSKLIWEIRRERRMEFAFEHSRIIDLRRWKKLEYMDTNANPDLLKGTWVNFPTELSQDLKENGNGKYMVTDMNGKITIYDGTNEANMKGFFSHTTVGGRLPFLNVPNVNPYLAPIPTTLIEQYSAKGFTLSQTEGWPSL